MSFLQKSLESKKPALDSKVQTRKQDILAFFLPKKFQTHCILKSTFFFNWKANPYIKLSCSSKTVRAPDSPRQK